jgi:hypothetical protein
MGGDDLLYADLTEKVKRTRTLIWPIALSLIHSLHVTGDLTEKMKCFYL